MSTNFLRYALVADLVTGIPIAIAFIAGSGFLAAHTGLPADLLFWAGLALVPFLALLAWTASRPVIPALPVQVIVEINFVWAISSFALLAFGLVEPNGLGVAFVVGQALAVFGLCAAQWLALRQPERRMA